MSPATCAARQCKSPDGFKRCQTRSGGGVDSLPDGSRLQRWQCRVYDLLNREIAFVSSSGGNARPGPFPPGQASLDDLYETHRLAGDLETYWFQRMNRLKERADTLRFLLTTHTPDEATAEEIEALLRDGQQIRNALLHVFAPLAVSLATGIAGEDDRFDELISEANWTLMRAMDKFDPGRGFRFSTYATHAIRRNLYRFRMNRRTEHQRHVQTENEDTLVDDDRSRLNERQWLETYARLFQLIGQLDRREQSIIRARFGLNANEPPLTLRRLSTEFGISRERIRQLEQRAVQRLRQLAEQEGFDPL